MIRNTSIALSAMVIIVVAVQLPALQQRGSGVGIARTTPPRTSATGIETVSRDLSDKAQDAWNIANNQRGTMPVELYVALSGFAGSARAYAQMAADARDDTGLRGAAGRLVAQAREIDALVSGAGAPSVQDPWRLTQEHVARLSNLYTLGYVARGVTRGAISQASRTAPAAAVIGSGRFRWRGRVDGSDYIMLQNSQVTIRHIEYRSIRDTSYDLPVPLPQRSLQLTLTKLKGRGNVEIVRQPSAENNYTLTVLIEDTPSGDDFYEFEVVW